MATSTQTFNSIKDLVKAIITLSRSDANAFITQQDVINQAYVGKYASIVSNSLSSVRETYSTLLTRDYQNALRALILDLAQSSDVDLSVSSSDLGRVMTMINDWLYANSVAVLEQPHALTVSAVTGVGTGKIFSCYVDKDNSEISNLFNNVVVLKCINDSVMSRSSGAELFEIIPEDEGEDDITRLSKSAFGVKSTFPSIDPVTNNFLPNSFWNGTNYNSGTGVVTDLDNWTIATGATTDFLADTASVYRDTADQSLKFVNVAGGAKTIKITCNISKTLSDLYAYCGLLYYANASNGGVIDVTYKIGSKSTTVSLPDVSGVEASSAYLDWKSDTNCWLKNFKDTISGSSNSVTVEIEVEFDASAVAGSYVRIFGAFFGQAGFLGKLPFLLVAGDDDWALGDYFSVTSTYTLGTGLIVQAIREQFGLHIHQKPAGTGGYTIIADPA